MVEFFVQDSTLLLRYQPRDDASWIHERFKRNEKLIIKKTFHFTHKHLVEEEEVKAEDEWGAETVSFKVAGHIDVVEIKQPFDQCMVTSAQYRDNYIPLRELSGTVMQIEKYLFHLNKWGKQGEDHLTETYKAELPEGFSIKITNPGE